MPLEAVIFTLIDKYQCPGLYMQIVKLTFISRSFSRRASSVAMLASILSRSRTSWALRAWLLRSSSQTRFQQLCSLTARNFALVAQKFGGQTYMQVYLVHVQNRKLSPRMFLQIPISVQNLINSVLKLYIVPDNYTLRQCLFYIDKNTSNFINKSKLQRLKHVKYSRYKTQTNAYIFSSDRQYAWSCASKRFRFCSLKQIKKIEFCYNGTNR